MCDENLICGTQGRFYFIQDINYCFKIQKMNGFNQNDIVFVVETCQNCAEHGWNTRHDEAKYTEFFKKVAAAIIERIPNAIIMKNQIPKAYLPFELYNNLVPNEDESMPYYQQVPRTGAFEVSYKGLLIFSKMKGGYWPNCELVAEKCQMVVQQESQGKDCSAYLAGNTPVKGGGFVPSSVQKKRGMKGGSPGRRNDTHTTNYSQQNQEALNRQYNNLDSDPLRVTDNYGVGSHLGQNGGAASQPVMAGPHLRSPHDITGMVQFPAGTTSLLSKYLSPQIYEKYRGQMDKHGVPFEQMILSGAQNVDSGIGIYAGSHDAYYTFSDIFDKVIEDYHKHPKNAKHISNMDYTQLKCPPLSAEDASMIISTRIRVGRNFADFPLGPGISDQQRNQAFQYALRATKEFKGELSGKMYPLDSMTDAERKKLIEDHFLFKEGDRFLEAAGLNRSWPDSRAIFHNFEKTFLIWVNEEDQLRIISMQPGADILAVFTRLSQAVATIEKFAQFAHDQHLGYITSCPTNLGTALRASVHIKLPFLSQNKAEFQRIADQYYVQIRGIHGEHTETDDGIFDISNKRRLGRSEVDLVQDMYDGVKAMIEAEKKLAAAAQKSGLILAGPHLKKPQDITGMLQFPAGTKSLLCKYLTPDVFSKYKGKVDKAGVSFEQMILSGAQNVDSGIGIYAGSHDSYYTFADMFDKVIEDYHKHSKTAKHISNMDFKQLKCPPLSADDASMIISTRIRVGRNLADFPLGPGISKDQRDKVESLVSSALQSFTGELEGKYYALNSMSEADRKQLIEDHFLFKEGDRFLEACGLNRDWPSGRGIFHNKEKTFLVWINEEDQLRIISMQKGADILAVFTRLSTAATLIEQKAKFAHDDHLGYITSCPTNLGTALRASVHIKLPLLGKNKAEFQKIADQYYVQIRGIHGEHTETDDGIFDISNKRRLGRSEVDLVQDMYNGVKAMIEAEKNLRAAAGGGAPAAGGAVVKAGPHLKKPADITGMLEFPAGTKSLLCKYLTPEVYNKYKGQKDKAGVSFEQMILSGAQNVDSGIGIYAGSHDSYYTFSDMFDKVIEDYHKHGKAAKHISNMDFKQLTCPPLSAEDASMIISTRIRVGRNLADFPLGPGISKDQRDKVESLVSSALQSFTGELEGKYYALNSMSEADRKQLIEDHFLFKEGDRFLEACGLNRDWPSGRGIFHNKEKTFLVWINEEDQLRIISMQKGADILAVFTRLSTAATLIEQKAKFAHDDHLGYITSCPTNLGTALRASVHIKLPLLGKNKAEFQKIADQYYVQIRGIHGEHTETDDGIFDISNKRRLGRSEVDLVQDMYNGVKAMIEAEKKLQAAAGGAPAGGAVVKAGPHLKKPEDITGMLEFPAGTKSLLCKYLTPEVFNKYKGQKDKAGVSFEQMILSGAQNVDSGIGIYAGSHDSYYTFSDMFDKVIEDYHKHGKAAKHISNMDFKQLTCPPLSAEDASMIISTRIRVGRNLADFPLGPGISKDQRDKVESLVSSALQSFTGELEGKYYALNSMSEADRKQLIEDHFLFKEGDRFLEACGLNRDWPSGRGIFHNKEKTFLVWINEEDQLRIISMQKGADILAVFTRLSTAATLIEQKAKFAHDDHLGYITSCPTNLGTALRASVHIKLPLLGKNKAEFQKIADQYYVQIRGIHGEHTETDDGIFDISNKRRLGRSEVDLVQDMYNGVKAMIEAEKKLAGK